MTFGTMTLRLGGRQGALRADASTTFWLASAIVLAAAAMQIDYGVNTDTSWYITLAEKMLDGQRPYVDFIDVNSPSPTLLCLLPALASRLVGVPAEFMVDLFCFVGVGVSLWLSGIILTRGIALASADRTRLFLVGLAALTLLPGRAFAQREHIAVLACLPCLATLVVWAARGRVAPALSLLAGVGVGVALAIKPHFVLFLLPPLGYLISRVGWRLVAVRIELHAALAATVLYWIAVLVFFPAFFDHAAVGRDVYVAARRPMADLLTDPVFLGWVLLAATLTLAARKRLVEPLIAAPALASLGAIVAYLLQAKGWPYQGYPALAFIVLALCPLLIEHFRESRAHVAMAAVALSLSSVWLASGVDKPDLERAVAALGPRPKLMAIGSDIAIGHPLTRHVHGVWVGSLCSLWITDMSSRLLVRGATGEEAAKYEAYLRFDRERLVSDIVDKKPDAILIANQGWLTWTQTHPDVAAALSDYDLRATADGIMVYARRSARAL
jgi:hypothetical protein